MPGRWRRGAGGRCRSPGPRAALAAGCVAVAVGWVVLPLRGHYFAIASLAVVIVLRQLATNWTELTGGGMGLNLPVMQASPEAQALIFYAGQAVVAVARGRRGRVRSRPPGSASACAASARTRRRPACSA